MKNQTRSSLLKTCSLIALVGAPLCAAAQPVRPSADAAPPVAAAGQTTPSADEAGYAYGVNFGQQLYQLGITTQIPIESIARGLKDGLAGKKTSADDIQIVKKFVQSINVEVFTRNQAAAKEFLEHNAAEKGVKKTPSGLQYKIIQRGNTKAASPDLTDTVTVQYRGRLLDGTEFDSSYSRGKPATLALSGVIKGWQEALPLMKPGAKWQLFVPSELGYGANPKSGIPIGSLLIFDVELLSVAPAANSTPPAANNAPQSGTTASK